MAAPSPSGARPIFERIEPEDKQATEKAWEAYREELKRIHVLDPACGSGVFLMAAYDTLRREYERASGELADLRGGQVEPFDSDQDGARQQPLRRGF